MRSTAWPPLKRMRHGIPEMPYCPAIEGFSSVFIFTKLTRSPSWPATFSTTGESMRHGPHQGAQKSTRTGLSEPSTAVGKVLWVTSRSALITSASTRPPERRFRPRARRKAPDVRLVPVMLTGLVLVALAPAVAGPRPPGPATVLVIADVGENARRSMPAALWRKLATDYVGRSAAAEDGTALPDDARCRTAHLQYAVFATSDRAYGIARFTVRNCATGAVTSKTVRVESEPLSAVDLRDDELTAPQTWERAVRATLAREPLLLPRDAAAPASRAKRALRRRSR